MTTDLKTFDKATVNAALASALAAKTACTKTGPAGCARIYVGVYGVCRKTITALAAACKDKGLIFQRKAYYSLSNVIYVGYSVQGREYAQGEAFAEALKAAGIPAYVEAMGD